MFHRNHSSHDANTSSVQSLDCRQLTPPLKSQHLRAFGILYEDTTSNESGGLTIGDGRTSATKTECFAGFANGDTMVSFEIVHCFPFHLGSFEKSPMAFFNISASSLAYFLSLIHI